MPVDVNKGHESSHWSKLVVKVCGRSLVKACSHSLWPKSLGQRLWSKSVLKACDQNLWSKLVAKACDKKPVGQDHRLC